MVFPEMLNLDQVSKSSAGSAPRPKRSNSAMARHVPLSSWCADPLEQVQTTTNGALSGVKEELLVGEVPVASADSQVSNVSMGANRQFIQSRIRHLVDAFSTRAQAARERIQMPQTPSSISSHDNSVQPTPAVLLKCPATPNGAGAQEPADQGANSEGKESDPLDPDSSSVSFSTPHLSFVHHCCYLPRKLKNIYNTRVIDPQGSTYVVWMSLAAFTVLYNAWVIPLRSTFPYQSPESRTYWMICDYLADFIYVLDIVIVQPRIMFLSEGFWIKDMEFTRKQYMKKRKFKMDLLSLLPLDLLYLIFGPEMVILRFPRFFKLHTFWDFFNLVDKLIASPHFIRITRTLLYMMYLIHLNACAYYAFSAWEGIGSNNFVFNGKGSPYIKCFYFATKTATSIGKNPKPTKQIEFMFMTVSWLMGVFVFALLIGQIRDIIATATRSQTEYRKLVDETLEYMRRLNLPQEMQRRVQLWFNYTWETQHTLDENIIMDCLPTKMKTDIAINVHIKTLSKVNLFADCDEALLRELVLQLKSVIYLPGDYICRKGDVGKEMYIIQSGRVQVIGPASSDEVLATLSEGSVFGEISLLGIAGMSRRTADVKSQGYSNLFVLNKCDLTAALSHYPEAQTLLNRKAKSLMRKNADLEKKRQAHIVINNPEPIIPHAKLIETVLQVVPAESRANALLRYGSRGRPRSASSHDGRRLRRTNKQHLNQHLVGTTGRHYGSMDSSMLPGGIREESPRGRTTQDTGGAEAAAVMVVEEFGGEGDHDVLVLSGTDDDEYDDDEEEDDDDDFDGRERKEGRRRFERGDCSSGED